MSDYYFAAIFPTKEGHFTVEFPDFPEAFTQGATLDECMVMGKDVLDITVEEYAKARKPLPQPSNLQQVKAWAETQRHEPGIQSDGDFLYQMFAAPSVERTPVRINLSLAKYILAAIDAKAQALGMTRSGFVAEAAMAYKV